MLTHTKTHETSISKFSDLFHSVFFEVILKTMSTESLVVSICLKFSVAHLFENYYIITSMILQTNIPQIRS